MEKKRILAAVDGSPWSYGLVRYVTQTIDPEALDIVLFHVLTPIPESFWDIEKNPVYRSRLASVRMWKLAQKKMIEDFLNDAQKVLREAGVADDSIKVVVKKREVGISRDILLESKKEYDLVAVGQRGVSPVQDLIVGSVTSKLLGRLVNRPLWIVNRKVITDGILVAMDSSEESMKTVSFVGSIVGRRPQRVLLLHVIRGVEAGSRDVLRMFTPEEQRDWIRTAEKELERAVANIDTIFAKGRKVLEEQGVPPDMIQTKLITGAVSRAATIVDEAKSRRYGTVVVGRRGLSRVAEFFMGRVSNKVIQLAKDLTVWVVN